MGRKTKIQKRADENRQIRAESLRQELKSREYIRQISRYLGMTPSQLTRKVGKSNKTVMDVAKFKIDGYFRLLAKTLPDLKQVEIDANVNVTENPVAAAGEAAHARLAELDGGGAGRNPEGTRTH